MILGNGSLTVTLITLFLVLLFGAMAAWALSEYKFKGNTMLGLYLAFGIMMPIKLGTVSVLQVLNSMGLVNTLTGLIIVYTAQSLPLAIWILSEFMKQVNNELKENDGYAKPEIIEKVVEKEVSKDITLDAIEKISNDKEKFFKMKLGIFEMENVKNSKDRAWKAKMRKATSTFALLGALNEGLEKMKNESNESQD